MGRIVPYIMENNKCLKPPTRHCLPIFRIFGDSPPTISISSSSISELLRVATEADDFLVGGLNGFAQAVLTQIDEIWRDMARMEISPVTTSCHEWLVWWFSMLIHHIPSFTYVFTCFYHWSLGPPIIFLVIVGPSLSSHEGFQCIPAMLDYQSCSASGSGFEFDTWIPGDPRRHGYTQKTMDMMKDAPSFDRSIR